MSSATPHIQAHPAADEAVLKALATGTPPPRAGALPTVLAFGWRGMLKIKHVPEQLMDVTIMPVLIVFLFSSLFGGATGDYLQFLLPGLLVMVLFSTVYSGVALNTDVTKGVVDRFRSLPILRPSPLVGAVLGNIVRYFVGVSVIIGFGVGLGYRPEAGFPGVLAAGALAVLFASGFSWVFTTAGLLMRAPSPRVRGNPSGAFRSSPGCGSIPACAGEPYRRLVQPELLKVYPRVCGGTSGPRT